jgi:hypothetical protein
LECFSLPVFSQILFCYITVVLFGIGGPTNIICAMVFYRRGFWKDRVNMCMLVLAVMDFLVVTTWFIQNVACYMADGQQKKFMAWSLRQWVRG